MSAPSGEIIESSPDAPAASADAAPKVVPAQLSLRANFSWTFVGNAVYAACQWGMLVILARLTSPEAVGQFSLGLAITAPIIMLSNLGLRSAQASDTSERYHFGHYLSVRLTGTVLAMLAIVVAALLGGQSRQTSLVIMGVGLAKCFEALSDVFYGLLQQHERMDRVSISLIIKGAISLPCLGVAVFLTRNVLWGTVALAVSFVILLLTYDVRSGLLILRHASQQVSGAATSAWQAIRPLWDRQRMLELTTTTLPLGLTGTLGSLNPAIPRYVMAHHMGERELGFYSAMAYLLIASNTIVMALGQSGLPRLAKHFAMGDLPGFRRLLVKQVGIILALGVSAVVVALVAGRPLLGLIYGAAYAEKSGVFCWVAVSGLVVSLGAMLNYALTAVREFRVQFSQALIVTATSALASLTLIPHFQMLGAALVPACASGVQVILVTRVLFRVMRAAEQQSPATAAGSAKPH